MQETVFNVGDIVRYKNAQPQDTFRVLGRDLRSEGVGGKQWATYFLEPTNGPKLYRFAELAFNIELVPVNKFDVGDIVRYNGGPDQYTFDLLQMRLSIVMDHK